MKVNTIKTIFFRNVCQLVIIIASPKQPQSVTGLKMASINVRIVKNDMKSKTAQAVKFFFVEKINENPIINSNELNNMANEKAVGSRNSNPNALK